MLGTLIDTGDKILSNIYDTISVRVVQMKPGRFIFGFLTSVMEETLGQLHVVQGGSITSCLKHYKFCKYLFLSFQWHLIRKFKRKC